MSRQSAGARKLLADKVARYHESLLREASPSFVREYLKGRGIDRDAAIRFRLGVTTGSEIGLDWLDELLVIPYLTHSGPVTVKYRCLSNHECKEHGHAKYLAESGESLHLYNAHTMTAASEIVIVTEGELDAVVVESIARIPSVGYPGVEAWESHRHFRRCLDGVERVIVIADGDKVGRDAAKIVAKSLPTAAVAYMPTDHDSNSFLLDYGREAFLERIGL